MIDEILFVLSTYTPVILEGKYGQGKKCNKLFCR